MFSGGDCLSGIINGEYILRVDRAEDLYGSLALQIVKNGECMFSNRKRVALSVSLVLCLALVIVAAFCISDIIYGDDNGGGPGADDALNAIYIDGELCYPKSGVQNYLVMGIDKYGEAENDGLGQADFLMVLSFDSNTKTYTMVPINRDTMVTVDEYDDFGGHRRVYKQIALSHSYAGGEGVTNNLKCKNTAKAASEILMGMEFNGYMSMTMDAVAKFVEYIGGVEVTFEGETVVLDTGESAIAYIRARSELADGSNITRMARQEAFLRAFFAKLGERQFSESELITLYDEVRPYVCNDAGDAGYEVFFNMIKEYSVGETVSLKGAATKGKGGYIEFYVNEEHVKEVMLDVFYDKTKK